MTDIGMIGEKKVLKIWSCNLHVVHGAFKTSFESVSKEIGKLIKASYNHFHDSPSRGADYTTI